MKIMEILEKVINDINDPNIKIVDIEGQPMIVTNLGEMFTVEKRPGGSLEVRAHFTGGRVTNGISDTRFTAFSCETAKSRLEYEMMHYFSDYERRLACAAEL